MDTPFTAWLTQQLQEKDLSMRELARRGKISHTTISLVISGERKPTYEFCVGIAKGLGLPPDEVLALAGKLPKSPELTPELQEWIYIFEQLTDEDRAELMQFGRYKVGRREKLKAKT
jgi:transcriptional regulator with XRE-family HTH domain